jgi:PII-like signaling protein
MTRKAGKRIRIFLGEAQEWRGQPLYRAILERVQQHGARGATVLRGIEGFGPQHHLSTERLPDLSENLPLIIEIVETNEHAEALLPVLDQIVQRGMITVTEVEIIIPS